MGLFNFLEKCLRIHTAGSFGKKTGHVSETVPLFLAAENYCFAERVLNLIMA